MSIDIEEFLKLYADNEELQTVAQLVTKYGFTVDEAFKKLKSLKEIGVFDDFEDVGKWMIKDSIRESPYLSIDMLLKHIDYEQLGRRNAYHPNLIVLEVEGKILLYRED
ncbi:MAG: hypothetical protein B7C55_04765 [Actinomycetales bacterium mxb001]|nr:MAG: hypothetical protein B7C55_04765 [Actinomycetales bacterium mxb001]